MATQRIALVTGANQGLGLALVEGLAARMAPRDTVLLTGRDPEAVRTAAAALAGGPAVARVEGRVLDVRDGDAIAALAAELGEVDIVFSNAAARMSPDADRATRSMPSPRPTTSRPRASSGPSRRACVPVGG